jgi:4-amino-4-deoxy-L-arabinose transferase-like glycosyltransferase
LTTLPKPALASQRAVQRLPRLVLLLFCAAYVLPGIFSRDPWKNADVAAFGAMLSIAEGRSAWLAPTLGGLLLDAAPLPYGLGALAIRALGPWLGVELAARLPFALLLVLVLVLTWYAAYHLARTEAAQPVPFAFGGEAHPVDYARAIADGALLALIATLGLLQLGHETTPELAQLASVALFVYAMAAAPFRAAQPRLAMIIALPALAASGAPVIALGLGLAGVVICRASSYAEVRRFALAVAVSAALACSLATLIGAWAWRTVPLGDAGQLIALGRQFGWFAWPAWPLAAWTLWRWRAHWSQRHIAVPLGAVLVVLTAWIGMGGADRALLLMLPPLALLAAFSLPTLTRSASAAVDWFSVFFFSACGLAIWVVYLSLQTGVPAKPAANVAKLAPGFEASFSVVGLVLAALASVAWVWLVRWRTGRNRHPLWKSMVLPASGVALCWLLLMTLWLPLLDYARSYRPLVDRLVEIVPREACVAALELPLSEIAALEHVGRYRVDAATPIDRTPCRWLMAAETSTRLSDPGPGWQRVGRERRPTDREDFTAIYRRAD